MDVDECSNSENESSENLSWIKWYCAQDGNHLFCEIDEEYINDRFNLTGLSEMVPNFRYAHEMITENSFSPSEFEMDLYDQKYDNIIPNACHLYGLVHARYIMTPKGMEAMYKKYKMREFGCCPRYYCNKQALLPVGLSDIPERYTVSFYCCRCEELYTPPEEKDYTMLYDGAYFGTGFPHMFMMTFPKLRPVEELERYVPKLYGFKVSEMAALNQKTYAVRTAGLRDSRRFNSGSRNK